MHRKLGKEDVDRIVNYVAGLQQRFDTAFQLYLDDDPIKRSAQLTAFASAMMDDIEKLPSEETRNRAAMVAAGAALLAALLQRHVLDDILSNGRGGSGNTTYEFPDYKTYQKPEQEVPHD